MDLFGGWGVGAEFQTDLKVVKNIPLPLSPSSKEARSNRYSKFRKKKSLFRPSDHELKFQPGQKLLSLS